MIYYSGTRYMTLARPLSFDRRAWWALSGAGGIPLDVDRQLSAVHRRHVLRAAQDGLALSALETPRTRRRPPG